MKRFLRGFCHKSLLLICLLTLLQSIKAQTVNAPFFNPTPGEITLMASTPIPDGQDPTVQAYQDVVNCGFNLVVTSGSPDYFLKQFELIKDLNLKFLVNSPVLLTPKRPEFIKSLKDNPKLGGWQLKDEPSYASWPDLSKEYHNFLDEVPGKLVMINLVGELVKFFTGPSAGITSYLEDFQNNFHPQLWSYDFYPIIIKKGDLIVQYDQFYSDLEDFSKISRQTERPFWAFCETMQYETKSYSRPAATEPYLKFEAYNALAYGAQGIVYWTYGQRKSNDVETYLSALVNMDGKKTRAWYAAQKVNSQIKKFNDIFYQCNVKEVRHTGDRIYKGTKKLSGAFGPFSMVRSGEAGVVVSLIENNEETYVVIVNRDVFNKQKVTLELSPNNSVVNLTSSKPTTYNWKKDIKLTLDKADWVILQLNK